jgi:hypothetical protein
VVAAAGHAAGGAAEGQDRLGHGRRR